MIDPTSGIIYTANLLNHATTSTYTLTVEVTDGQLSSQDTVVVNVGLVNQFPPDCGGSTRIDTMDEAQPAQSVSQSH